MNRVTWIRIGIVTVVVAVGTFAIWKAISPGESKPQAKKAAEKAPDKSAEQSDETKHDTGAEDNDPFAAAKKSFGGGTVTPAAFVSQGDDTGAVAGDRYAPSQYGAEQNGAAQSGQVDPYASRNMLPENDRYPTSGASAQDTAQQSNSADRYGIGGGTTEAGDGHDPFAMSSRQGYDAANTDAAGGSQAGNPLRGVDGATAGAADDPMTAGANNLATDGYGAARQGDQYGTGATGTSSAGDSSTSANHDPFGNTHEPARFGGAAAATTGAAALNSSAANGGATDGYFDRYSTAGSTDQGNTGAGGFRDTPLPGETAAGSATDAFGNSTNSTTDGLGSSRATRDPYSSATADRNDTGYDPRQQPGPDYYGGAAAGAGQQIDSNTAVSGASGRPGFDPFADGGQTGGYAPTGYAPNQNANAAGGYVDGGVGEPGDENLEGPQSPQVVIQKSAPSEIQVGKPAIFEIVVRNDGDTVAHDVEVRDEVPRGTQLLRTSPVAQDGGQGRLLWAVGNIPPREERVIKVELMPVAEGEIGSVATVHVAAAASVRTIATRPDLRLEVTAPTTVMIGEDVTLKIKVRNPGTGMAEGIMVTERVPQELRHDAGDLLEYEIGQLEPGGSRELELTLTAAKAGRFINALQATGDAGLQAVEESRIEVIAPDLKIDLQGPAKRYLERPATYTISVANPGTAAAKDVELVAYVPQGMEFLEADNYGEYDKATRVVRWSLEELPAAQEGAVSVKLLPTEAGDHRLTAEGSAQKDLFARSERALNVEGVAAILFEVVDVNDPIEVGSETTYEIRVLNQGSKVATNIQLEAVLPPEMKPVDGEGPTRVYVDGNRVTFEPLAKLAPRADTKYRIKVKGLKAGDLRLTVRLLANEMTAPVIKEESTRVYADQ